jgi:hypothetical protein
MNRKLLLLGLVAVLVIAVAVPALGASTSVTPQVSQELSVRALAKARLALLTARSAKSESRRAARTAEAALNAAGKAIGPTGPAGPPGPAGSGPPPVQSDFVAATVGTESETYVQLPGGPSVTVDATASGLVEVWAQVTFHDAGAVGLFEDGQLMAGQSEFCAPEEEERGLLALLEPGLSPKPMTLSTPSGFSYTPLGVFCGGFGPPAPALFQTSPGHHSYELRYQFGCSCEPEAAFSNRLLRVAPRL